MLDKVILRSLLLPFLAIKSKELAFSIQLQIFIYKGFYAIF